MAHMLDDSNGRWNIAFAGSRESVWHGLGQEKMDGQSKAAWTGAAGLGWNATLVPASITYPSLQALPEALRGATKDIPGRFYNVRSDNGFVLSDAMLCSDRYENVQPAEIVDFLDKYISVDDRFSFDVIGALDGGRRIWGLAKFNGDLTVGNDAHKAYLLASTTYDGSGATIVQMTTTRVVCNNTIRVAHGDKSAQIKIRHNTRFNADAAGKQLATLAQSVTRYKAIGDALAQNAITQTEVMTFFKTLLDIPATATKEDVSTRKLNQYNDLFRSWLTTTKQEGTGETSWGALQAVTRYCDHDRSTRGGDGTSEGRLEAQVTSNFFGSGDALKGTALNLLLPRVREKVLIPA